MNMHVMWTIALLAPLVLGQTTTPSISTPGDGSVMVDIAAGSSFSIRCVAQSLTGVLQHIIVFLQAFSVGHDAPQQCFAERGEIEWLCPWLPVHGQQRMHATSSLSHMRSSVTWIGIPMSSAVVNRLLTLDVDRKCGKRAQPLFC